MRKIISGTESSVNPEGIENLSPLEIIDYALSISSATHVIALFSGGHDSLIATHIASKHPRFSFACHLNTGIGIPQTRQFVRDTCAAWGIELREYKAADYIGIDGEPAPVCYRKIIKTHGFPGPAQHQAMYIQLKERPLRHMIRDLNRERQDRTILISGARKQESDRRKINVASPLQWWENTKLWVAPIWNFTSEDVGNYIDQHNLKRNEVSDLLHGSKECLCGAFAHPGELDEIRQWFPETAAEIEQLQLETRAAGFPWGWEDEPPAWFQQVKNGQMMLSEAFLCSSCVRQKGGTP